MKKLLLFLILFFQCNNAFAIDIELLANAIYYAEGGAKTKYPYGILKRYKITTPRQACINTIKRALRDNHNLNDYEFISFLGKRYAPMGVKNDPMNLNKNWVKNVWFIYKEKING